MTQDRMRTGHSRTGRDDGIGLAELIVAMALSVLLLTLMGSFFTSIIRGTMAASAADNTTRQASTALNSMVRYFHAATTNPVLNQSTPNASFVSIGATDVTFYAYVNLVSSAAKPVMVRYFIDPATHNLVQQLWASTCDATTQYCTFPLPSSPPTSQVILGGPIASPTSDSKPLFSYFDSKRQPTTALGSIDYVGINLEVGSTTAGTAGDTHISTVVGLLNLGQTGSGTS
jgi:hypothetical protein